MTLVKREGPGCAPIESRKGRNDITRGSSMLVEDKEMRVTRHAAAL